LDPLLRYLSTKYKVTVGLRNKQSVDLEFADDIRSSLIDTRKYKEMASDTEAFFDYYRMQLSVEKSGYTERTRDTKIPHQLSTQDINGINQGRATNTSGTG